MPAAVAAESLDSDKESEGQKYARRRSAGQPPGGRGNPPLSGWGRDADVQAIAEPKRAAHHGFYRRHLLEQWT